MPLHLTEVAQCPVCEEYSRLSELKGVKIKRDKRGDFYSEVKTHKTIDGTEVVGACPHCGDAITTHEIC